MKKNSQNKKVQKMIPPKLDWDTTDEDEIARRKLRANTENICIKRHCGNDFYYASFMAQSDTKMRHKNSNYLIEIRSLDLHENSCGCLDFQTNKLGTCKHIEKTLLFLQKHGKNKFLAATKTKNPLIEIYLDTINDEIKISRPVNGINNQCAIIDAFFSTNNCLIGDPTAIWPKLNSTIKNLPPKFKNKIRLSTYIEEWVKRLQLEQNKAHSKEMFNADIKTGKRSDEIVKYPLYPYQFDGVLHLAFNERALLADEMGLGKTVQAIAACELLRELKNIKRVLVVSTTSLKTEWAEQITKFSDLKFTIIQGPREARLRSYQQSSFFYLANYEQILFDRDDIQRLIAPDVIILDEAQRIKNWHTKTAKTIKKLSSKYAFVLTGTPLENRIDDIYSIVQFLDPHLLGPLFRFNREYYQLDNEGRPVGYKKLDQLHNVLKPIILRRLKNDVEEQLPTRTEKNYFVTMHNEQATRYEEQSNFVARLLHTAKKRPLRKEEMEKLQRHLACMRMLCDTPFILDQECRISPKLDELEKILEEVFEDPTAKILIFSEWERMLLLVKELALNMKINYAWHTGSVPQHKRRQEINRFKNDSQCKLFLSTESGSVGLNLQAANVVINLDLPWNPAKLEQRIARAWRKHQLRSVHVINIICENSIEQRMIDLLKQKSHLAKNVLLDGNIKEMDIPSGRAAFIERMEELMGAQQSAAEQAATGVKQKPESELEYKAKFELAKLSAKELIIINNLVKSGIISINQEIKNLFSEAAINKARQKQKNINFEKAKNYFDQAKRKYDMAKLLVNAAFYPEAIAPLNSALNIALTGYAYSNEKIATLENVHASQINECLSNSDFPGDLFKQWQIIQNYRSTEDTSTEQVNNWLQLTADILGFVEKNFHEMRKCNEKT